MMGNGTRMEESESESEEEKTLHKINIIEYHLSIIDKHIYF